MNEEKKQDYFDTTGIVRNNLLSRTAAVITYALGDFVRSRHMIQAAALTYYTLFAIVPIAALLFGIAKGFRLDDRLKMLVTEKFSQHQDVVARVYEFADTTLERANGGLVAGIGVLVLFWTVIQLSSSIETSFNLIWHIRSGRNIIRRATDYIALVIVAPILLITGTSVTIVTRKILAQNELLGETVRPFTTMTMELLPLVVAWFLFSFIYYFVPNTKVRFRSAIVAGIVGGTLFHGVQMFYIFLQVALSNYNAIYGSFSALPLFLIWLQISWMLTLFGANVAYVDQYFDSGRFLRGRNLVSSELRRKYLAALAILIVRDFDTATPPPTDEQLADRLFLPLHQTNELLQELLNAGVVRKVESEDGSIGYLPALPTDKLTIHMLLQKINRRGEVEFAGPVVSEMARVEAIFGAFDLAEGSSSANKLLRDI
ncbi:MAG: YihY/virulence factor BrkB family protein [Victivallaceae bacterium]|nr:YihY/virulence factor BrkB family protein [Victivallaceae bacterium]